jgi:hypothetical protein
MIMIVVKAATMTIIGRKTLNTKEEEVVLTHLNTWRRKPLRKIQIDNVKICMQEIFKFLLSCYYS